MVSGPDRRRGRAHPRAGRRGAVPRDRRRRPVASGLHGGRARLPPHALDRAPGAPGRRVAGRAVRGDAGRAARLPRGRPPAVAPLHRGGGHGRERVRARRRDLRLHHAHRADRRPAPYRGEPRRGAPRRALGPLPLAPGRGGVLPRAGRKRLAGRGRPALPGRAGRLLRQARGAVAAAPVRERRGRGPPHPLHRRAPARGPGRVPARALGAGQSRRGARPPRAPPRGCRS